MTPRRVHGLPNNLTFDKQSKRYRYRNPLTGKRVWFGRDKDTAIERAEKANVAVSLQTSLKEEAEAGLVTVEYVILEYIDQALPEMALSEITHSQHIYAFKMYARVWGDQLITRLPRQVMKQWIMNQCSTYQCRKKHRMRLIRLFAFAMDQGWIDHNEAGMIQQFNSSMRIEANRKKRARLSIEEFWQIHDHAPAFLQVAMKLSLLTLQARQELCNMKWADITDGRIKVIRRKVAGESEAGFISIGISPDIQKVLTDARQSGIVSPYIVHHRPRILPPKSQQVNHWTYIKPQRLSVAFKRARDKSGVSDNYAEGTAPSLHEIRSLGSRLYLDSGYTKEYVRMLMAHSDVKTTEIYLSDPASLTDEHFVPVSAELKLPGTKA